MYLTGLNCVLAITGPALEWIRSYVRDRTPRIQIDDSFSASRGILWFVPQGLELGLLLLPMYLLPLGILITKHNIYRPPCLCG